MSIGTDRDLPVLALDVDGVVVHPHERFRGGPWDTDIQRDLGIDPRALGQHLFKPYWPEIIVGKRDLRETLDLVLPELNPDVTVDEFLGYWFTNDARLDAAVAAEIRAWRERTNGPCIAVTNQEKYRIAYLTEQVGLGELFDHVVWSGELGLTKSNLDFYLAAQATVGCDDPRRMWFFDDDQANVAVAGEAGWRAHFYAGFDEMRRQLAGT
ncbi:HAD-IA family hydrolase [Micromonospora sp. Llam7]|uniref:HAD family hydrolase n=1 Tax=Micromonospora tarapacensis TaxID=2835305 RepID=UPI001C83C219|nr:HAD-IA family hydrolase [Micromonospora tarapacensis]MBX7266896.1 HAD-IA family hydrolase [Micromonospora tarapacensis]